MTGGTGPGGLTVNKEIKQLLRQVRTQQGFRIRTTKRGHHLVLKDEAIVACIPGTPSDWRSIRNSRAALRRAGFEPA